MRENVVFVAHKPQPTAHPSEFAPMEHGAGAAEDELVYSVRILPQLHFSRDLHGRQSLQFECLISCYAANSSKREPLGKRNYPQQEPWRGYATAGTKEWTYLPPPSTYPIQSFYPGMEEYKPQQNHSRYWHPAEDLGGFAVQPQRGCQAQHAWEANGAAGGLRGAQG